MLRKIDLIGSSLILLIGIIHSATAFHFIQPFVEPGSTGPAREAGIWFFSGGILFTFGAGLNFLRIAYGRAHRPIIQLSTATNLIMLGLAIWLLVNNPSFLTPGRIGLIVVLVVVTFLSIRMQLRR